MTAIYINSTESFFTDSSCDPDSAKHCGDGKKLPSNSSPMNVPEKIKNIRLT